jgi:carbon monoxide dehydrogenase subunit G
MKVSGSATLHAPVERVWAALNDPAVLVRTIPGCERLEEVEPDEFRMTVTAGVASIKGTYAGDVRLLNQQAPHSFVLKASGAGAPGTVAADVTVRLKRGLDGTTLLTYDADAIVGGAIGGVGQRILTGVAKRTAGEFFAAVDGVLTGVPAAAPTVGVAASAAGEPTEPALRGVFVAPPVAGVAAGARAGADFMRGAAFGAAVALLGAAVGGWAAGRRQATGGRQEAGDEAGRRDARRRQEGSD